jgi:hypothetical protein
MSLAIFVRCTEAACLMFQSDLMPANFETEIPPRTPTTALASLIATSWEVGCL